MEFLFDYFNKYIQLTNEEKEIIISKIKHKTYLKGQYIVQEGDVVRYQTFIVSGVVRTFHLDTNGNEHIISFGIENWWTGDLCSFVSQTPADFNVQCLNKTRVIQVSYAHTEELYVAVPKLERFFRILVQNAYIASQKRIIRNHSLSARERYLLFLKEFPEIAQRVPQYMIASYLGITKEFLSHIRSQIATEPQSKKP